MPANAVTEDGQYVYVPQTGYQARQAPPPPPYPSAQLPVQHGSPYGAPVGVPGAATMHVNGVDDRVEQAGINRGEGVAGEAFSAGPTMREDANGDRKIVPSSMDHGAAGMDIDRQDAASGGGGGGFTAVNQQH